MGNRTCSLPKNNNRLLIWGFSVCLIGLLPILLRFVVYFIISGPIPHQYLLSHLDIIFAGLAFNWSNLNETITMIVSTKKNKLRTTTTLCYLFSSVALITVLSLMLGLIYHQELKNAILKDENAIANSISFIPPLLMTILSLIMNYTLINKLKTLDL